MKPIGEAVEAMMAVLGLDGTAVATRKAFLGFSDTDIDHLRKLHEALKGLGSQFAQSFYDHMLRFPETRRFIPDDQTLERLKQTQAEYFDTLTAGEYGPDYIRHRLRVGIAHQRIGLETQWYLGAYAKYLVDLLPEIWQRVEDDHERLPALQSLLKIVLLDMGLAIDTYIHADRQAILALKEYAELVFSAIPDGLVVLTSDFIVLSANRAFLRRFDLTEADMHGRPLLTLIAAEGLEARLTEVRSSGTAQHDLPFEMGLATGTLRMPVRVTLTGIRLAEEEEEEEEARLLMIVEDMTEQARLQQALKESEATLLRAQAVAHIGSWQLDFKTGEIAWSPEVYRIFGLPVDTLLSYEAFLACVHSEEREMVDAAWQAAAKGAPYHVQHRILVDKTTRWVEERAEIEFDADGHPLKAVGTVQDITERKATEARIEYLAFYDPLTGLPNRALFMDRLKHELAAAERRNQRLSLLFLDLDRFKEINDTQGHNAGDRVLSEVARRFRQALREEETLARLSGDEFVIIASDSGEAATRIADRIGNALLTPIPVNGQGFLVSASIGIAIFPEDGRSPEELLKHADIAMYRAKAGGGGYRFYRAEMGTDLERTLAIAHRLETALAAGQLQLHYQPQVHLPSGRITGAEALARWHDAEWGMVSPVEFIPIAEERGLISTLGEWALAEACRQVHRWQEQKCPLPGRVAVNVAARQFEDDGFVDRMLRIAAENGVAPSLIELELTESGMMRDPERAVEITRELASAGFALSIDDFGTGYSSLTYLKRFPVHKLKIDISFVRDMLNDRNDYSIVSTIIAMGRSMELETLAEGVEHAKQAEVLLALGCQLAQGYHFGHPEAADDFERMWLRGSCH
ncbi:MAG: EAL domain-containing protein [Rugosibacter sp.]|nr:MAG: EAL domain-containing protein [Rugosibacter sp.]